MSLIGALLGYVLTAFMLVLVARAVLSWVGMAAGDRPWVRKASAVTHSLTEPVIAPVRRVLRPARVGGLGIDLAFTAVFVGVLILRSIAFSL
ncbi:YggT family protein [Prauserella shujinwangii]|uniref:YggT family protein n=1 Tax=Prauserella shujinwangii TaxID=1453103 RepID=A0A2T0M2G6_9PSEU|nr:YggT family protein [Prauserella shujinwangii]PRX50912.1 YggT family protein [Prauserella shujinwangii]